MVIRFGDFELDEGRFELRRNGEVVAVQRRVLETIFYLALRAGRLVTREELASGPWGGMVVGDAAIARAIKEARAALGDTGEAPSTIVTVRGVGFRFEAEVREPRSGAAIILENQPSARTFVGRERELSELELAWSEAQAGHGNLVLVVGAPGIGKSSLVERFVQGASARGGEVHWGRCFEAQGTPPYWPWPELLRSYTERHGSTLVRAVAEGDLPELASIAPALSSRLGAPPSEVAEGPYSAFRALDAVARFFRRAAESRALVLVLEDVHEAEGAALDLLTHLQRSLWDSKLLIVATCRSAEGRERKQLGALLDGELAHARTLEVCGLTRGEVSRWFENAGGGADADELSERVARVTDGHPLLIANLIRALPSDFGAADLEQALARALFIPENLSTSIRAGLDALDPDALELVRTASVLGEEPWLPVLGDLMQSSPAELGPALDRALRAGVLERRDSGRLRFTHALIRELLYRDLSSERRLSLHGAAAVALSVRLEDHPELVIEAAHHAVAASPCVKVEETVELLIKAAGWARRRLAFGLAAEHLRWALQTLDLGGPAPRKRAELLLDFAQSLHLAGRAEEAVRAYNELYEIGSANGYRDYEAEALIGDYEIRREGIIADGTFQKRLSEALQGQDESGPFYAELLATRAIVTPFLEDKALRTRWLADALRIGRKSGAHSARLATLHAASRVEFYDNASHAIALADEFKEIAASGAALDKLMDATMWRADCLLRLGRGAEFEQEVAQLEALGSRLRHAQCAYVPLLYQCVRSHMTGDLSSAEQASRAAWALGVPSVGLLADALFAGQLSVLAFELDGPERERVLRETLDRTDYVLSLLPGFETIRISMAAARFDLGFVSEGAQWLERVREDERFLIRNDRNWLLSVSSLVYMACRQGDRVAGGALLHALRSSSGLEVTGAYGVGIRGPVNYWLGRLSLLLEDGEAVRHFEAAIVEAELARSRSWKGWAELGLAQALAGKKSLEELRRADAARASALRAAESLRLPRLRRAAEGGVDF